MSRRALWLVVVTMVSVASLSLAYAAGPQPFGALLAKFKNGGWKGTGAAEMHNMALSNWDWTGPADTVTCSVCGKKEGGWSSHEPSGYHNAGCPFKSPTYAKSAAYRAKTFNTCGWKATGNAAKANMISLGWLHTCQGDTVFCPVCKKFESSWSTHNPADYHQPNCPCRTKGACNAGDKTL